MDRSRVSSINNNALSRSVLYGGVRGSLANVGHVSRLHPSTIRQSTLHPSTYHPSTYHPLAVSGYHPNLHPHAVHHHPVV